jgi:hypothetical protein
MRAMRAMSTGGTGEEGQNRCPVYACGVLDRMQLGGATPNSAVTHHFNQ